MAAGATLGREALAYVDALHNLERDLTGNAADAEDLVQDGSGRRAVHGARRWSLNGPWWRVVDRSLWRTCPQSF